MKSSMNSDYQMVFEGLGYNVKSKGAMFFGDLIGDVRELLKEGKTEEEIKELLPRYYVEYYHFCYEGIGREKYLNELRNFCAERTVNEQTNKFVLPLGVEDSLLFFAKMFNGEEKDNDKAKVNVKEIIPAVAE